MYPMGSADFIETLAGQAHVETARVVVGGDFLI
jgi:hypothetical protein